MSAERGEGQHLDEGGLALRSELHAALGVSRERVGQLLAEQEANGFPEPSLSTITGKPLWRVLDLTRWHAERRPGRPKTGKN